MITHSVIYDNSDGQNVKRRRVSVWDVPVDLWGRRCRARTVWVCGSWLGGGSGHTRMTFQPCQSCLTAVFFCWSFWAEKPRWPGHCREESDRGHGNVREMTHVKITHTPGSSIFPQMLVVKQNWIKNRSQQAGVFDVVIPSWDLKSIRVPEPAVLMAEALDYCFRKETFYRDEALSVFLSLVLLRS